MKIEWGAVCRPKQGQTVSGDTYVVEYDSDRSALVSVIDGLGGGREAAYASNIAADVLRNHVHQPIEILLNLAHRELKHSRGAVIGVLRVMFSERQIYFSGVGNVGVLAQSNYAIKPISKNGILGYRLPTLLKLSYSYNLGDTFVLYSDGISTSFSTDNRINYQQSPQQIADTILAEHGKFNDDATVVALRVLG